jgi:hypothetical protein
MAVNRRSFAVFRTPLIPINECRHLPGKALKFQNSQDSAFRYLYFSVFKQRGDFKMKNQRT